MDTLVEEAARRPVLVALRADRLADLTAHAAFSRLVERGLYLVGGLDEAGLRLAVVEPARQAGLILEPGLVDLLVTEVRDDPGPLPLLSHALLETWKRREGNTLTVDGYRVVVASTALSRSRPSASTPKSSQTCERRCATSCCACSPPVIGDTHDVAIASYDGTVYHWDTGLDRALDFACQMAGRDLTEDGVDAVPPRPALPVRLPGSGASGQVVGRRPASVRRRTVVLCADPRRAHRVLPAAGGVPAGPSQVAGPFDLGDGARGDATDPGRRRFEQRRAARGGDDQDDGDGRCADGSGRGRKPPPAMGVGGE